MSYTYIISEIIDAHIRKITINRPAVLNALCASLLGEIADQLQRDEQDDQIRCTILTGSEKAFAAGADISEMVDQKHMDVYKSDYLNAEMTVISNYRKPLIAFVSGYALGGGCELAMACDFIIASETAKFGQPEITIGTLPGMGGSQRLTRAVGKPKAMEMILTGRMIDAVEAEHIGLVARIFAKDTAEQDMLKIANDISGRSLPALMMAKEAVQAAEDMNLHDGLRFERRLFHSSFSNADKIEGMTAFIEKRAPKFKDQ